VWYAVNWRWRWWDLLSQLVDWRSVLCLIRILRKYQSRKQTSAAVSMNNLNVAVISQSRYCSSEEPELGQIYSNFTACFMPRLPSPSRGIKLINIMTPCRLTTARYRPAVCSYDSIADYPSSFRTLHLVSQDTLRAGATEQSSDSEEPLHKAHHTPWPLTSGPPTSPAPSASS
jgi:hypothetical protein